MRLELIIDAELTKAQLSDVLSELSAKIEYSTSDKWQNVSTHIYDDDAIVGKFRLTE